MKLILVTLFCISSIWAMIPISDIPVKPDSASPRIIGGKVARAGEFPWQAAIYLDTSIGKFFCGGALISNQWILTAGHCVYGAKQFTIHLGSNTLLSSDENRLILATSTYVVHPDYNQNTLENDVGLIKLHMPITFTDYIQTITLANESQIFDGVVATAAGWGQTSDTAVGLNNNLHYVDLSIISNTECQITYGNQIKSGMVCAVGNFNEGICIGDTGSPLVKLGIQGNSIHVGIASFMSQNGCESLDPTGYTRTDIYHPWISNITSTV
ncbi:brachyurin [Asbolus verrucosus]|uniref:Brachyurin n=1 Tax=Asbolus verrucosus TaxID=1661398 RepID=A0A482VL48_ASBVE|nr:brachyurin [Asbolus verrucosus]